MLFGQFSSVRMLPLNVRPHDREMSEREIKGEKKTPSADLHRRNKCEIDTYLRTIMIKYSVTGRLQVVFNWYSHQTQRTLSRTRPRAR